jgi:hypothetical protein
VAIGLMRRVPTPAGACHLADCTPAQVTQVDACSQSTCSGPDPEQWAIVMCIGNITCVDM